MRFRSTSRWYSCLTEADEVAIAKAAKDLQEFKPKSLFVCAGDVSADQHASRVVARLRQTDHDLHVWGIGGRCLEQLDAELLYRSEDLTVIGLIGVFKVLPLLAKVRKHVLEEIGKNRPDCVLLVDYGGFNLNLAGQLRQRFPDLPILYLISPQVWGSRPWRIKKIAATISKMLVIFPFEETLYKSKGINAEFVGHPLTEKYSGVDAPAAKAEFCETYGLDPAKPIVGIFPGSRTSEVRGFMPLLLQAITWLKRDRPEIQFVLSQTSPKLAEHIYDKISKADANSLVGETLRLIPSEDNTGLMASSDILWTKSGTTTLEATFMEKPMLVFYRADWLTFMIFLCFKRVQFAALPNLLAGRMLVPELFQLDCRAEQLVRYTRDWLDVPAAREAISAELKSIKSYLNKGDFAANAASNIQPVLDSGAKQLRVIE